MLPMCKLTPRIFAGVFNLASFFSAAFKDLSRAASFSSIVFSA
jgi:hypothetical protein